MAGRFADKPRVYSQSQYRAGPKDRAKLGPKQPRTVAPRGPWKWGQPVVVLQGRRTMSSAESFAAMMGVLPGVTTMGDETAGSSGNPEVLDLGDGIVVNVPRWNDLDAAGKPIEDVGIAPKVRFEPKPAAFTSETDALVLAAIEHLKKETKGVKRAGKPAKK
jgi:C-terminal processing protease CtpA/Prc